LNETIDEDEEHCGAETDIEAISLAGESDNTECNPGNAGENMRSKAARRRK